MKVRGLGEEEEESMKQQSKGELRKIFCRALCLLSPQTKRHKEGRHALCEHTATYLTHAEDKAMPRTLAAYPIKHDARELAAEDISLGGRRVVRRSKG